MINERTIEWIYLNNKNNRLRFALGEKGDKMVACLGINPSTAKPDDPDNTLGLVKRITKFNGYDGWVMFNIYPQRAADIGEIDVEVNTQIVQENLSIVKGTLIKHKIHTVWLAYGDLIESRPYLKTCLLDLFSSLNELDIHWKIIQDPTRKGHPGHPLYKAVESSFRDFDIQRYIKEILKAKPQNK